MLQANQEVIARFDFHSDTFGAQAVPHGILRGTLFSG
jgi:hypothetical protein